MRYVKGRDEPENGCFGKSELFWIIALSCGLISAGYPLPTQDWPHVVFKTL